MKKAVGPSIDVKKHFTPKYSPWDQRLCLVPDADFFKVLKSGKATVETDTIERFTETGIALKSGKILEADLIITATGLTLKPMAGLEVIIDGKPTKPSDHFSYYGVMGENSPNLISIFGYINASWTLRADLISTFFCKLINYMDHKNFKICTPRLRESDKGMEKIDFIERFNPGYITRSMEKLPKQGTSEPWVNTQDYKREKKYLGDPKFDDEALVFE